MSKRTKIIVIIIAIILGLILVVLGIFWLVKMAPLINSNIEVNQSVNSFATGLGRPADINEAPPLIPSEPDLGAYLLAIATTFTEKFGSFSNQGNFENLNDLRSMMTPKMIDWTNNYVRQHQSEAIDAYYGITTKALLPKIADLQKSQVTILITTQRQETKNNTLNPQIFYQDLKLQLKKINDNWLVDEAEWQ